MAEPIPLVGTLLNPDGTNVTGWLFLNLNKYTSYLAGDVGIVPSVVPIKVINGAMQNNPAVYGNDVLGSGTDTYYSAVCKDNNGNLLFKQAWYILGTSFDVSLGESSMSLVQVDY